MFRKRLSPSPHQENFSNAGLFFENIKKEVYHYDGDQSEGTVGRNQSSIKRRSPSVDNHGNDSVGGLRSHSLKVFKHEEDVLLDSGDATFSLFASLFDSALQGAFVVFLACLEFTLFSCVGIMMIYVFLQD